MSFSVADIDRICTESGMPLTPQQKSALEKCRKQSMAKAREEIRNAVRSVIKENGLNVREISEAAKDMAKAATAEAIGGISEQKNFEDLLYKVVRVEVGVMLEKIGKVNMETLIREHIKGQAQSMARDYVEKHILITALDNSGADFS